MEPSHSATARDGEAPDVAALRRDLLDAARGYVVLRQFLQVEEVDRYREECAAFLRRAPRIHRRILGAGLPDYVHPRTAPTERRRGRGPETYRIYQFLHNRHSPATQALFDRALGLRDAIEAPWLSDDAYRAEHDQLRDYVQVTQYVLDSRGLPRHSDTERGLPYPLLQPLLMLSQTGVDYEGGDLRIYPQKGDPISADRDLALAKGDLLFFDRSLEHEVTPSRASSGVGRWAAVIGARDRPRGSRLEAWLWRPWALPVLGRVRQAIRSRAARVS